MTAGATPYTGGSRFIFHSQLAATGHITIEAVNKVFARIGYKGEMCGHGWRHAFVTNCKEKFDYNSDVIYKQMSHTIEKEAAKATYDKAEFLPARTKMMQDYADYLDNLRVAASQENQTAQIQSVLGLSGYTQEGKAA